MAPSSPPRHALVSGCSSGIGRSVTVRLLRDGWQVTGISRQAPVPADEIQVAGFRHVSADLSNPAEVEQACSDAGQVDALVHAAGVLRIGTLEQMSLDDGELMWRLHVDAAARLVQALAPGMKDGSRIVLLGSRVASGSPGKALYAASKSALTGLARSFAAELAGRRITVNVIAPAATDTPMLRDPARIGVPPVSSPMGRFIQPEEIAALAAFLLSDMACSITGQQIVVCGGASL